MKDYIHTFSSAKASFRNAGAHFSLLTKDRVGFYYDIEPKFLYPMFGDDIFTKFQNITTGAL